METVDTTDFFTDHLKEKRVFSLLTFLDQIRSHVGEYPSAWVEAEITKFETKGDNIYLQLAESDGAAGTIAKSKAWIGKIPQKKILPKFYNQTGTELCSNIKVRLLIKASLHAQFGFSLTVQDIDPQYTLGDIEQKLNEMRRALKERSIYDQNKRLHPCPNDFLNVAVLSPDSAASLADFREVANRLDKHGLCRFTYFNALFQGDKCSESILDALRAIFRQHQAESSFCALCIIRGGGAAIDLAELNQLQLARAVCWAPLPILTGIGHEPDHGLLDEVASFSFDTPSKLALYIQQMVTDRVQEASSDWTMIQHEAKQRIARERLLLERIQASLKTKSNTILANVREDIEYDHQVIASTHKYATDSRLEIEILRQNIASDARHIINESRADIDREYKNRIYSAQILVNRTKEKQEYYRELINEHIPKVIARAKDDINLEMQIITGLSPQSTLSRGFALIRNSSDELVSRREKALEEGSFTIEFADGKIAVKNVVSRSDDLPSSEGSVYHE